MGDLAGFERVASLWPVSLPGGDAAVGEPWRMACAWLSAARDSPQPPIPAALLGVVDPVAWRNVGRLAADRVLSPVTTSMGRLFDAVAALSGIRPRVTFEGQAAIELEALCAPDESGAYPLPLVEGEGRVLLDARETIVAIEADLARGALVPLVAAAVVMDNESPGPAIITERDLPRSSGRGEDVDIERVRDHLSANIIYAYPDWSVGQRGTAPSGGDVTAI